MTVLAKTLVHHGAVSIAEQAVRTFALCFVGEAELEIHSDGSLTKEDESILIAAAGVMKAHVIRPEDRKPTLDQLLREYPLTYDLLQRGGYFTKLELPIAATGPYFYFDSDIVWLHSCDDLIARTRPNAFSTESWSWYYGLKDSSSWLREEIPRRVNSGFYFLGDPFPFVRMESMLQRGLYDPDAESSTDQEIMAYLYPSMELYHLEEFRRSRRGKIYDLSSTDAVALHFPGRMWEPHIHQIKDFQPATSGEKKTVRRVAAKPLSWLEIERMWFYRRLERATWARLPLKFYRSLRTKLRSFKG